MPAFRSGINPTGFVEIPKPNVSGDRATCHVTLPPGTSVPEPSLMCLMSRRCRSGGQSIAEGQWARGLRSVRYSPQMSAGRSGRAVRMSSLFLRTLRDDPADAEVDSHRLLVRAGCIRRVASGIYSWLPLGDRVLRNVAQIVREEMDARRGAGGRPPDPPADRAVGAARAQRGVRPDDVPGPGPQGEPVRDGADGRGGRHDPRGRRVLELPRPAGEPLPDQLEVPRRAAAAVRAAARRASS